MTTEEKAKAYDEALGRAKKFEEKYGGGYAGYIFPELAESEDERVRKELVALFKEMQDSAWHEKYWHGLLIDSILSWLEKQKEQSITSNDLDEEIHRFFDDCIDVHEVKLYGNISERVIPVDCYELTARHFAEWGEKQKEQKSLRWRRIEDATTQRTDDGCCVTSEKMLVKGWINDGDYRIVDEGTMVNKDILCIPVKELNAEQKPAEWSEDKFPKDIEKDATQFCFDNGINITPHQAKQIAIHYLMVGHNEGYVEGRKNAHIPARELGLPSSMDFKQEWSEEDERMLSRCVKSIESSKQFADSDTFKKAKDNEIDWLKNRFKFLHPQAKVEWSEEDKKMRDRIIDILNRTFSVYSAIGTSSTRPSCPTYKDEIDWLKSLTLNLKKKNEDVAKLCSNEWSKEDEAAYDAFTCEVVNEKMNPTTEQVKWLRSIRDRLKSLRPSWKPSEEDIKMLEHIIGQYETGNKNSKVMGYLPRVEELDFLKKVLAKWKSLL